MKNVKKNSWIIGFSSFLDFNKKTRIFTRTFLAGLSKLLSTCPEEHFQSKISERKSWKLQDFRIIFEVFGSMAEKIFRVGKTLKDVRGNSPKKKFFKKRKFRFFPILSAFLTSGEKLCQICENRDLRKPWSSWGKSFFQIFIIFHTSLDFDPKKRSVGKFFHELSQLQSAIRASRAIFWLKVIFPRKVIFVHLFWSLSNFFVFWQKEVRVSKKQPTSTEKNRRKEFVEKSFLKISSDFQQKSLNN